MGTIKWIVAGTCAVLICLISSSRAHAASLTIGAISATQTSSLVEKAARCRKRNGRRDCAPVAQADRGYGYGLSYGQPRAEEVPFGTSAWWHAMDHESRGGASR
jgi:hypothetical protein